MTAAFHTKGGCVSAAPVRSFDDHVRLSRPEHEGIQMQNVAQSLLVSREQSRREDAELLDRACRAACQDPFPTQAAMARAGKRRVVIDASERQIINWMQSKHDMPSWAVKRVRGYLDRVERLARKIEGRA